MACTRAISAVLCNCDQRAVRLVAEGVVQPASAKILDTSVIIDGRIRGLLDSGLLEGQVIVAQAVIDELQALADPVGAVAEDDDPRPRLVAGLVLVLAVALSVAIWLLAGLVPGVDPLNMTTVAGAAQ